MTSSWGATETSPLATSAHFVSERAGVIGVPVPGVQIKLAPVHGKLEVRVKGPNVMPGYLQRPDLTAAAFDEDGFYRTGDAARLLVADDPNSGLVFEGRTAEDFKLTTGTWVHVGGLRVAVIAAATPLLQDAVVTGQDRDCVGLLAWSTPAARELPAAELRARLRQQLGALRVATDGSSLRPRRLLLLDEPPSIDGDEITDKGYVNQRAVQERRRAEVAQLYAEPPPPEVILLD